LEFVVAQAPIQSYRDLVVWQEAMNLAEACYRQSLLLPREELYGLSSQIRRSSGSVAANIAEGYGRDSLGTYVHHLKIAQGSLKELETHLLLGGRVSLLEQSSVTQLLQSSESLGKMLRSLIRSLENSGK
jgi:four helix bundle protein